MIFLALLLLAVQVVYDLYSRSAIGAAEFDAVRIVSGSDACGGFPAAGLLSAEQSADAHVEEVLGPYSKGATMSWNVSSEYVSLTVSVRNRSLLPSVFPTALGLDRFSNTVVLRREYVRP